MLEVVFLFQNQKRPNNKISKGACVEDIKMVLLTSSRSKSPVLKCEKLYFLTILSHCVPFPDPGPPKIQIIGTFESLICEKLN